MLSSDDLQTLKLEARDYMTTIVATITSDTLLVRVAKAAGLVNDSAFLPPRPDGQPYTDPEIATRMEAVVSAGVRKLTRLIDITATDTGSDASTS